MSCAVATWYPKHYEVIRIAICFGVDSHDCFRNSVGVRGVTFCLRLGRLILEARQTTCVNACKSVYRSMMYGIV